MNPNELKGIFQKKTLSEKNMPGGGKEGIQSFQLLNLLKIGQSQNLKNFLEKQHPSPQILNEGVKHLIKRYQGVNEKLYELLNILFVYGASPDISVIFDGEPQIKENEKISILMFAIKNNDLNLVKLILNFNPEINKEDAYGRTPIIYAVIFNNNDSTEIIKLLIQHNANINYSLKLMMSQDQYQCHSVFTLAIFQDLKNVTKCLLDNNVDVKFRTVPGGDTGLHIAAYYAKAELLELLLNYPKIIENIEVKNNDGKKPYEFIKDNEEKDKKTYLFSIVLNNIRMNNQNMKMNYPVMNNNMKNVNPQLNKMQQMNQMHLLNSFNELNNLNNLNYANFEQLNNNNNNQINMKNMNNGKRISVNNSPNMGYNYIPQGINMNIGNHTIKNNNMNLLNNYGMMNNNNINNNNMMKNMMNNNNISNESNDNSIENDDTNINVNNQRNNNNYSNKKNNNDGEDEKDINKDQNKEIIINQDMSQNAQIQNQKLNGNNKYMNIYSINPYKLNMIKNNFYNKLIDKNKIRSNFEIPVEFIKNKQNQNQTQNMHNMNIFMQQNNIPTLSLDLSSKVLSLELKLNELREKEKKIKIKYKEVFDKVKEILQEEKKQRDKLNNKEKERIFISSQIEENTIKINDLYTEQQNIVNMFPPNKLTDKFYKNIADVKKIKFEPKFLDENFKIQTLNKDLIDYEKYVNYLNIKKKPKIDLILQKIRLSVNEVLPGYDIKLYGAYGCGIYLPWSDINVIIFNNNKNNNENKNNNDEDNMTNITDAETNTNTGEKSVQSNKEINNNLVNQESDINNNIDKETLTNIFNCIKKYNIVNNELNSIIKHESITYLILTTNEEYGRINIYISIDRPNHPGLKRLELIKCFMKEYPPLRPTILALEKILKNANLINQYQGGLPFYGLILMVVSFIQNQKEHYNYTFKEENINGTIFYEFLKNYGIKFDFNKYAIMTYKINEFNTPLNEKENQYNIGNNSNIKELIILDPIDKKTNVAKQTYQYMNIKMAFLIAFMVTQEDCECGCHYGRALFEHNYISAEHCYLKRMFNSVKRFNDN